MSFLFAPTDQPAGQDIGELDLGGSEYGKELPRLLGYVKVPGNLFWVGNVYKTVEQNDVGGKGFGGGSYETTKYSGEFAVQFGLVPDAGITGYAQIWVDNTLVYSSHEYSTTAQIGAANSFWDSILSSGAGVHYGSSTQGVDPLIAQRLSLGNTVTTSGYLNYYNRASALQGIAYLTLNNQAFNGGRIPSVQAELVVGTGSITSGSLPNVTSTIGFANKTPLYDGSGGYWYFRINNSEYQSGSETVSITSVASVIRTSSQDYLYREGGSVPSDRGYVPFFDSTGVTIRVIGEAPYEGNVVVAKSSRTSGAPKISRGNGVAVNDAIAQIMEDSGIPLSSLSFEANSNYIRGLVVQAEQRRETVLAILRAYDMGYHESNGFFEFYGLYRAPVVNIPWYKFGSKDGRGASEDLFPFSETRETDLPNQMDVKFTAFNSSGLVYDTSSQSAKISAKTFASSKTQSIDLTNFVFTAQEAAKIAQKQLYRVRSTRRKLQPVTVPPEYMYLTPNDIFTTSFAGLDMSFRITKTTLGKNWVVELECEQYGETYANSDAYGAIALGHKDALVPQATDARLYVLNLPALTSAQTASGGAYIVGNWLGGGGSPGRVYLSRDNGATWGTNGKANAVLSVPTHSGDVTGTLAAGTFATVDTTTSLTVTLHRPDTSATIENVSETDIGLGFNLFFVGSPDEYNNSPNFLRGELIQARTVSFDSTRTVATFTNLYRGRKGSEGYVGQHVAGETFVWLGGAGVAFVPTEAADTGRSQQWQLVPPGLSLSLDGTVTKVVRALRNNMLPLHPRFFVGTQAGFDLTFSFTRRTRIDGYVLSTFGTPLGETTETYRLIIYTLSGVRAAYQDFTPNPQLQDVVSFTYTQAMRGANFGSTTFDLTGYTAKLCQMSSVAGEGNPTLTYLTFTS